MKKLMFIKFALGLALSLGAQTKVWADSNVSTWVGEGQVYDLQLKSFGSYNLEVVRTKISENKSQSKVTVTLEDKSTKEITCTHSHSGKKWTSVCSNGNGGGFCLGE